MSNTRDAVVLTDIGCTTDAVNLSTYARTLGCNSAPLLRAWLAAAHGETLVADGQHNASLHAFDDAQHLMPPRPEPVANGPFLALDDWHLIRWRGHALACFGHPDAITVLIDAPTHHDTEFTRAEAGLRTDLVLAHVATGERDTACDQFTDACRIADAVGSVRQRRRLEAARRSVA